MISIMGNIRKISFDVTAAQLEVVPTEAPRTPPVKTGFNSKCFF